MCWLVLRVGEWGCAEGMGLLVRGFGMRVDE